MKTGAALLAATIVAAFLSGPSTPAVAAGAAPQSCPAFLNQDFRKLHSSENVNICKISAGKPMLIINTASNCGYHPAVQGPRGRACEVQVPRPGRGGLRVE